MLRVLNLPLEKNQCSARSKYLMYQQIFEFSEQEMCSYIGLITVFIEQSLLQTPNVKLGGLKQDLINQPGYEFETIICTVLLLDGAQNMLHAHEGK